MQGNWNHGHGHGHAHYRCPQEYALANTINHPLAVYLREDTVLPVLDAWLAGAFAPDRIHDSLNALDPTQPDTHAHAHESDLLRQAIVDCDHKLARHRAALEAGADPAIVTQWIAETQTERAVAVAALDRARQPSSPRRRMTRQEIKDLIDALGGLLTVLGKADPEDKAKVYQQLGLRLTYDHETQTVLAEAAPRSSVCVVSVSEGRLGHYAHLLGQRERLPVVRPGSWP